MSQQAKPKREREREREKETERATLALLFVDPVYAAFLEHQEQSLIFLGRLQSVHQLVELT